MRKLLMVILKLLGAISIIVDEGTDSEDLNAGAFLGLITALCAYAAVSEENLTEILYHNFNLFIPVVFNGSPIQGDPYPGP